MTYRQRANAILALAFVCFVLVFWWWYENGGSLATDMVFFIVQSALIGSIADWFAVSALFEKPLGFPYHTELVHRNRDKLIEGLTKVISERLLQPQMWEERLWKFSPMERLEKWVHSNAGREKVRELLYQIAAKVYSTAQGTESQANVASYIRTYLKKQPIMMWLQDRLVSMLEDPDGKMLDELLRMFRVWVKSDTFQEILVKSVDKWIQDSQNSSNILLTVNKFTGLIDSRKVAQDISSGISVWLDHWDEADSEERQWLCRQLELRLYAMSGQLTYTVQDWQNHFVDSLPVESWLDGVVQGGAEYFQTGLEGKEKIMDIMEREFLRYVDYCDQYPEINQWLNDQIRRACAVILKNEHALIGVAVRQVLMGFDKQQFNDFIESKVGEDLAWIRINGALVGGTIGFLVFCFLRFLYDPYVGPVIRSLFS